MKESKFYFCILSAALMLLVLSAAIAFPILFRPFYYAHIAALDLPGRTGWSAAEIRNAYDEMLDYCILGAPFGTGVLRWSYSGMAHFADCARLFRLDFAILGASALTLGGCAVAHRCGVRAARPLGRGSAFWAGSLLAAAGILLAALAVLHFEAAVVLFHHLVFAGKDNWLFDPTTDQIILILPKLFFRNCAIAIAVFLLIGCAALILWDLRRKR